MAAIESGDKMDLLTRVEFGQDDVENVIAKMSPGEIDHLAFGAIQLDRFGTILAFNETESTLTGRRRVDVVGRNFFSEVAPCCNKPGFRGVFEAGVKAGRLNVIIDYVFDYKMNPTRVKVHMKTSVLGDSYWMFVPPFVTGRWSG